MSFYIPVLAMFWPWSHRWLGKQRSGKIVICFLGGRDGLIPYVPCVSDSFLNSLKESTRWGWGGVNIQGCGGEGLTFRLAWATLRTPLSHLKERVLQGRWLQFQLYMTCVQSLLATCTLGTVV